MSDAKFVHNSWHSCAKLGESKYTFAQTIFPCIFFLPAVQVKLR